MARPLRIEYDAAVYHVTSRGNKRKHIFKDDEDIKVIFISGYPRSMLEKRGVLGKGIGFIQKPVSPNELLRKIRETLDMI